MSWKKIKSFLILLFLIINLYLIFTTSGSVIRINAVTSIDEEVAQKTVDVISKNYSVDLDTDVIPLKINNLNIIDVTNYIYTDDFLGIDDYKITTNGNFFDFTVNTDTFSYNEQKATPEIKAILSKLGIEDDEYTLEFSKRDSGLSCLARGQVSGMPILNSYIFAEFMPTKISVRGHWYMPNTTDIKSGNNSLRMADVTSSVIDCAMRASQDGATSIEKFVYGYYVSSYDESALTKISSAIPCYMIKTDNGLTYFYDALNGKFLKQEE